MKRKVGYTPLVCDPAQEDGVVFTRSRPATTERNDVTDITVETAWLRECTNTWLKKTLTYLLAVYIVGSVVLLITCAVTQNALLWDKAFATIKWIGETTVILLAGSQLSKLSDQ